MYHLNSVYFVNSYQATLLMCGLLILTMGRTMSRAIGGQREIRYFRLLTWSALLIDVGESIWNLNHLPAIDLSERLMRFLSCVNLAASAIGTMCLFSFGWAAILRMGIIKENKKQIILKSIPAFFMVILNGISYWTGYTYTIDSDGVFVAGPLYCLQLFVCLGYLVATIIVIVYANKKANHTHQLDLMRIVNVAIIAFLGGAGQVVVNGAPIVSICNALGMTYLNISLLHANVTTDALTGLTNRSKMSQVLNEKIESSVQRPFTLYIEDVNNFKKINDTYGHQEGDEALKRVANAFREFGKMHRSIIVARYGGDEFLITIDERDHVSETQLEVEMQGLMDAQQEKANANYRITLCFGGYEVASKQDTKDGAIKEADNKMYRKKQVVHNC